MELFNLPISTKVGRIVPKNAFNSFLNTKQKKLLSDCIQRTTWTNKISHETINLSGKEIEEIQIFKLELKTDNQLNKVLDLINKYIPYHVIFWIEFNDKIMLSTASKHPHPTNNDIAVVDWTFNSDWFNISKLSYSIQLKQSIDYIFKDFCFQLKGLVENQDTISDLVEKQKHIMQLKSKIEKLQSQMKKAQFNKKVELNLELTKLKAELSNLI
jgi:hypothetical protein